jgi:hypothetical protein
LGANDIGHLEEGPSHFFLSLRERLDAVEAGNFQRIERIGNRLQMLVDKMQVDQSVFEAGVSEQDLNGAQVGSGVQQVGGARVPQTVWDSGVW